MIFLVNFKNNDYDINFEITDKHIESFIEYKNLTPLLNVISKDKITNSEDFKNWIIDTYIIPDLIIQYDTVLKDISSKIWDYCYKNNCWSDCDKVKSYIVSLKYSMKELKFKLNWIEIYDDFYKKYLEIVK